MLKMNLWDGNWGLYPDICPCDVHFNDWTAARGITGKTIYHFGTGNHHVVGLRQVEPTGKEGPQRELAGAGRPRAVQAGGPHDTTQ